jgi:small subunit ribosomal protein S21
LTLNASKPVRSAELNGQYMRAFSAASRDEVGKSWPKARYFLGQPLYCGIAAKKWARRWLNNGQSARFPLAGSARSTSANLNGLNPERPMAVRSNSSCSPTGVSLLQVFVRDNNVDQALRVLKKKLQREGVFREMRRQRFYEKPSARATREKAEAIRRARKLARKEAIREGLIAAPKKRIATAKDTASRARALMTGARREVSP